MGLGNPWQPLDALAVTAGAPLRRFPSDAMHVHVQNSDDSSTCALLPAGGFLQVVSAAAGHHLSDCYTAPFDRQQQQQQQQQQSSAPPSLSYQCNLMQHAAC
jgi:hypothetical protein